MGELVDESTSEHTLRFQSWSRDDGNALEEERTTGRGKFAFISRYILPLASNTTYCTCGWVRREDEIKRLNARAVGYMHVRVRVAHE